MTNFVPQFLLEWIGSSKYVLLFLGTIFEGPIVMLTAGFLYRLDQFSLIPMYAVLLAGDFVADIGWYAVGYFGAGTLVRKYGKIIGVTPEIVEKIETRFKKYQSSILIISKLTMGFGFALATLVVAGILKVSLKKYITINFIGGFIWTAIMITVGYFFGNIYLVISRPYKIAFAIFALVFVFVGLKLVNRYLIKQEI